VNGCYAVILDDGITSKGMYCAGYYKTFKTTQTQHWHVELNMSIRTIILHQHVSNVKNQHVSDTWPYFQPDIIFTILQSMDTRWIWYSQFYKVLKSIDTRKQEKKIHIYICLYSFSPDSHNSIKLKTHKYETKPMLSIVDH
jgi:hypothetical protein